MFKKNKKSIVYNDNNYNLLDINKEINIYIDNVKKLKIGDNIKKDLILELKEIKRKILKTENKIIKKAFLKILDEISLKYSVLYVFYGESFFLNYKIFKIANILKKTIYFKLNNLYENLLNKINENIKLWNLYVDIILESLTWFLWNLENYNYGKEILDKYFSYSLIKDNIISKTEILLNISVSDFKKNVRWKNFWIEGNAFYIYDEADWDLKIYFSAWLSLDNLNSFLVKTYELLKNKEIKIKKIYFVDDKESFKNVKEYIYTLQKNNIRELDSIKIISLKRYFLTVIAWWLKIWDYDMYLSLDNWRVMSWFAQVQQWDWYKIIERWYSLSYENVLDDLRILWVELNGMTTLRDISLANGIRFRISVILRNDSFAISIRKMGEWFENKDFIRNFWFDMKLLLKEDDLELVKIQEIEEEIEKIYDAWKKTAFFPLESFLNYKDDIKKVKWLYNNKTGAVIVSWTTWHGKSSLLKSLTIDYFNYYYNNKKIRKKVLFFEAPIEHLFRDFHQVSYNVEKPEQLTDLIIASKTQNPQMTVIWETKDPYTMSQLYDLVWLTQAFTTLHKWSVMAVIQYLNEVAKQNKIAVINYLNWTNMIITQHMVRDIIKNKQWWLLTNRLDDLLTKNKFMHYYYNTLNLFNKDTNKFTEYENKWKYIYEQTLNWKIEKEFKNLLLKLDKKYTKEEEIKYTNIKNLYDLVLEKIPEQNKQQFQQKIEEMFANEKYILYTENLDDFWKTIGIVNEMVNKTAIKRFFSEEWKTTMLPNWKEVFLSLEEDFEENVFSAKLANTFYKYMWIENYFNYKYLSLFILWKMSFNWEYSWFFKEDLKQQKEWFKKDLVDTLYEKIKNNNLVFNNIK